MLPEELTSPVTLRFRFVKLGRLKFISHLDLCRTLRTALIRSGLPVFYTEGFNPHPKTVFALPLSLGTESVCELMDIKMSRALSPEEAAEKLSRQLPEELKIIGAYIPSTKFTAIAWSEYMLGFDRDYDTAVLCQPVIEITKKTKSGEKLTDIRPQVLRFSVEDNLIKVVLCADNNDFLNPSYIISLLGAAGSPYTILRTHIYTSDGVTEFE